MPNTNTQTTPIAKEYKAVINFTYEFTGEEFPDIIIDRETAYDHIRETITADILGMGFDSYNDLYDSVEIFESEEKLNQKSDYNVSFMFHAALVITTITTDKAEDIIPLAQAQILDTLGLDVSTATNVDIEELG